LPLIHRFRSRYHASHEDTVLKCGQRHMLP
jgi:hypothetical protein